MLRFGRRSYTVGDWPHSHDECGGLLQLFLTFRFVDLLWVFAVGWKREYGLRCASCSAAVPLSLQSVESQMGNRMPLRYRYGWVAYVAIFATIALVHH